MAQVIFSIDLLADAKNWVRVGKMQRMPYGRKIGDFSSEIPRPVLIKIKKLSKEKAIKYTYRYLRGRRKIFQVDLMAMKAILEEYFEKHGTGLLKEVGGLVDKPLYTKRFYASFTLLRTCPYDPKRDWFMISVKQNIAKQLNTVCHEILHLQFIHYYYEYCLAKGLNEKQFQDLKEALTVLLNGSNFDKYHLGLDRGYPDHIKLRQKIIQHWRSKKDFISFLNKCITAAKVEA